MLPVLIQGQDYSRVMDVLHSMAFQSSDVKSALEAKVYLYSGAQAFMEQLSRDLAGKPWRGTVRRVDGAELSGSVTGVDGLPLRLPLEQGAVILPMEAVSPRTPVEMASAFTAEVTDSTDYYRRQELTAVFARVNGLSAVSAAIAAPLMEENRDFRMRWLKVL